MCLLTAILPVLKTPWLGLELWVWILIGFFAVSALYQLFFYFYYLWRATPDTTKSVEMNSVPADGLVGVSVLVCAHNEAANLQPYIQSLLTQNYPKYEVIVVNDGSQDYTTEVLDSYLVQDARLKVTFVPQGARVGSTKKLGLTLAAKAAQYDYLLLTDADCRPESPSWITSMIQPVNTALVANADKVPQIVLGYSAYFEKKTLLSRLISYDTLFNGLHFIGAARAGRPYMGVGRNLLYKKELFFSNGGFSAFMMHIAGDDDLFVNRLATAENTVAVTSRESVVWSLPKTTWKEWLHQKRRHLSVSPYYRFASKLHLAFEPITRGLFYMLAIALAVLASVGMLPLYMLWIVLGVLAARFLMQLVVLNRGAYRLGQRWVGLRVLAWDILLPLVSLVLLMILPLSRKQRW